MNSDYPKATNKKTTITNANPIYGKFSRPSVLQKTDGIRGIAVFKWNSGHKNNISSMPFVCLSTGPLGTNPNQCVNFLSLPLPPFPLFLSFFLQKKQQQKVRLQKLNLHSNWKMVIIKKIEKRGSNSVRLSSFL